MTLPTSPPVANKFLILWKAVLTRLTWMYLPLILLQTLTGNFRDVGYDLNFSSFSILVVNLQHHSKTLKLIGHLISFL